MDGGAYIHLPLRLDSLSFLFRLPPLHLVNQLLMLLSELLNTSDASTLV